MRFGRTLRESIYPPWKDHYIDYSKLKALLREDKADDDRSWTEDDENAFCDEVFNVQLEKVAGFQEQQFKVLEQRANEAGEKLRDLAPSDGNAKGDITTGRYKEIEDELDTIINETKELKRYSNINYTGFLKIVKKHDRKRGNHYKIRPMLQMSLGKRPFNSEQVYTPLLNKLSMMYFAVRQQLDESTDGAALSNSEAQSQLQNGEKYTAYKFWVHPDNLLEIKTYILRRLPVLVYSEQSSKELDGQGDPTLNSIYFDNPKFSLYLQKVDNQPDASSLRLRWFGQLDSNPELFFEHKTANANGSSEEKRFTIKDKYIVPFIKGEYKMEKTIQKMERQGLPETDIAEFKDTVNEIQTFIKENDLQPMLRVNYTRTAFQKPLDDKVRISIDTSLAFIREDALDQDRPCRNPEYWHRLDIDNGKMVYPFSMINQGEISRFPFAVLEIKVKEDVPNKKHPQWVQDLMASHLVYKAPRFSKFIYGVASLFEDHVNNLPFWLSEVETDIRKDPQSAFNEEQERKAKKAEDDAVVGSILGASMRRASFKPAVSSPVGRSYMQERMAAEDVEVELRERRKNRERENAATTNGESSLTGGYGGLSSVFPSFSLSRYAQSRREKSVQLPPGVVKPGQLIKDSGPLKVEPKVWLANERTFLKWQHISILLGGLAVGLYSAAGGNTVAEFMGIAYTAIAIFAGLWGYAMHRVRRDMIVQRSGKDFDNMVGPLIVSFALMIALLLNFIFQYRAALGRFNEDNGHNVTSVIADSQQEKLWKVELIFDLGRASDGVNLVKSVSHGTGLIIIKHVLSSDELCDGEDDGGAKPPKPLHETLKGDVCVRPHARLRGANRGSRRKDQPYQARHGASAAQHQEIEVAEHEQEFKSSSWPPSFWSLLDYSSNFCDSPSYLPGDNRSRSPGTYRTFSESANDRSSPIPNSVRTQGGHARSREKLVWPPLGLSREDTIPHAKAMKLIAAGAPLFKGRKRSVPHASKEYFTLYAIRKGCEDLPDDRQVLFDEMFTANSFRLQGPGPALYPWETLEHPSMAFCYGSRPGTVTLNHWVSLAGNPFPDIELRDPGVKPRNVEFSTIVERLIYLEGGLEEDDEERMYRNLYKVLLKDPDKNTTPHKAMEMQITDLILVLSRPDWIDFSRPENQVVAKFFANPSYTEQGRYKLFFHQLLLSMELYHRIQSKKHADWAKEKLLTQLPSRIAWDLALARRWHECISIEQFESERGVNQLRFHLLSKRAQVKALRKFIRAMKWPNRGAVDNLLKEQDPDDDALEDRSSDAMCFFTGVILPGVTFPWLLMNTLIDCDDDSAAKSLSTLTHMQPHCGFQYKGTTYWSSTCIVGKVVAPTCKETGGWVGPARPAPDLERVQIARIRQRHVTPRLTGSDVKKMVLRSDPRGSSASVYPVADYQVLLPDRDEIINGIRIEKIALRPVSSLSSDGAEEHGHEKSKPGTFDATVRFAMDGRSWPISLLFDVSFVSAYPCGSGPHPLWKNYHYRAVKVDELLEIKDWPISSGHSSSDAEEFAPGIPEQRSIDEVLIVEAFGIADNEVLARAWCSSLGFSAVVADMDKTCMACAVREAYAGRLNVAILIDGGAPEKDE
ncbi:VTC domain-containing protein [Xylogone sp. PMI_703]|nr:VTC domain-containing protein [Xylogone sp. PMI_703]